MTKFENFEVEKRTLEKKDKIIREEVWRKRNEKPFYLLIGTGAQVVVDGFSVEVIQKVVS